MTRSCPPFSIQQRLDDERHLKSVIPPFVSDRGKVRSDAEVSWNTYSKIHLREVRNIDPIETPNSPYACSKMAMELYAKTYHQLYNLNLIGLRFFTVYGPRGRPDMAPYKFLKAIKDGTKFYKYGDGTSSRDYTYVSDIVSGVVSSIDNKKEIKCEVYNLGNSSPVSLNEFIELCEKVVGKKGNYEEIGNQLGDVPHTYADISKAKRDLDYEPKVKLENGLSLMYVNL